MASYVTLTGTLPGAAGAKAVFTPGNWLTDAADDLLIPPAPQTATLSATTTGDGKAAGDFSVSLLADSVIWTVEFTDIPGVASYSFAFGLASANGATQDISTLSPVAGSGGGSGFANPMTTLGDMMFEDATPAAARLAGDTSDTRKFLRSLSSGGTAQAPAWDTIQAGDLPVVPVTQGGTGQASQQAALDALAGAVTAGRYPRGDGTHVTMSAIPAGDLPHGDWLMPWQFRPEDYGAAGDGKVLGDVATTSGSPSITSASAPFTPADTGKTMLINGGNGTSGLALAGTITYVSATEVTLSVSAGATAAGCAAVYGTDDQAAVSAAVAAAGTYAEANGYFAEVLFKALIYMLASPPTQAGDGSTTPTFNSQVPLPYPAADGSSRKLVIALTGTGRNDHCDYWESTVPDLAGTCLVSAITAPSSIDATYGPQSVIGGPSSAAGFTGGFANVKPVVTGISAWCPVYTNMRAFDFEFTGGFHFEGKAGTFAPANLGTQPLLQDLPAQLDTMTLYGIGLQGSQYANNDDQTVPSAVIEGFKTGVVAQDHFTGGRVAIIYTDVALLIPGGPHMVSIAQLSCEQYVGGIKMSGSGCLVDINLDTEASAGRAYDVYGGGGSYGTIRFFRLNAEPPIVSNGPGGVKVINLGNPPGYWSGAPAVPGSGSPLAASDSPYRDAAIIVQAPAGVTVSDITLDGQSTGLTLAGSDSVALPLLPSGKLPQLTYSGGTPTWDWWLS